MSEKRQFIAGASCPECGLLDKVQRVDDGQRVWMECVRCGMQRDLDEAPAAAESDQQATGQPVAILPPGKHRLH